MINVPREESVIMNEAHLIPGVKRWVEVADPEIYAHPHNCIGWMVITRYETPVANGTSFLIGPSLVLTSAHNLALKPALE
jgi:hypothetical protein